MSKCYICNAEMKETLIQYDNPKFGDISVKRTEKAKAEVCCKCGEMVFSAEEVKRLSELSKTY